ncbi:NAD(P)H-dependent oxidoreductase subunit E [Ferrovum sp.]|uniref:NAD(P)H-dependent oxidoreductase subunit E n=2 Tax=Ferrovum sp. TaxID=2609467 RepID=UPI00262043D4|nr:NAD(P)H-dependent oxidoreductase subunit E [Ferrovum sp.]
MNSIDKMEHAERLNAIVADACRQSRHLLDVLHALQQKLLHIGDETARAVSRHLALPVSQVESVVGFHSFLLRIRGYDFELGDPLTDKASVNLEAADKRVLESCTAADLSIWRKTLVNARQESNVRGSRIP